MVARINIGYYSDAITFAKFSVKYSLMGSTYIYILQFDEKYFKNTIYRRPDKESRKHMYTFEAIPILKTF